MFLSDRSSNLPQREEKSILGIYWQWFPELEECVPKAPKIFVGNKIDLREEA